ncbi:FAD-binding oxidoreductase [Streptomyces sp. NPDC101490]|uniref:FAD-binding oxidoreductase n=1 Tax=Streptomyces sp. NPDC101490 TaxID=3366143 RepID=UPI003806CD49
MTTTPATEQLSAQLAGRLLTQPAFTPFNPAFAVRPAVLVSAENTRDVALTVTWAARRGLRVAVMATGHGITAPIEDGVLITTERMNTVSVDHQARTATLQAGVRWAQVVEAAAAHGLAPVNGSSSAVGAVGYTLGGGTGPLSRAYGFAADHVRRARLVDATGTVHDVDATSDPDLFWALRGGKGNFGIVTELEIDLMPVADLYGGSVFYPAHSAHDVLHAFASWSTDLPQAVSTTSVALLRLPPLPEIPEPLRGQFVVQLRYAHLEGAEPGAALLEPMRAVAAPLVDTVQDIPYSAVDSIHQDPTDPMPFRDGGAGMTSLPAAAVDALLEAAGPEQDIPLPLVEVRLLGGAMARQPAVPNAVSGRDAAYALSVVGLMTDETAPLVPGLVDGVVDAVAPWRTTSDLFNFIGPATSERVTGLWDTRDRARLLNVKRRLDPTGMFGAGHTLAWAEAPSVSTPPTRWPPLPTPTTRSETPLP